MTRTLLVAWLLGSCTQAPEPKDEPAPSAQEKAGIPPQEQAVGDRYVIDASAGRFSAQIGTAGLLSGLGHPHTIALRDFSGEALAKAGALEKGSLQITIKAASLAETGKDFSDDDRKKIDRDIQHKALEVAKYPEIVFKSTRISAKSEDQVEIRGNLTLHGVTRSVSVPAKVALQGNRLTARGEFTIRHSDFKIQRLSAAAGTVKAAEEIRLTFEIIGRKP